MMYILMILALLILDLKTLGSDIVLLKVLPSLLLIGIILRYAFFRKGYIYPGYRLSSQKLWPLVSYLFIYVLALLRTSDPASNLLSILNDTSIMLLLCLAVYIVFSYESKVYLDSSNWYRRVAWVLIGAPSLVIIFHLAYYMMAQILPIGIDADFGEKGDALVLSQFGIHIPKKVLPFSGVHPNTVGIYAGGVWVMTVLATVELPLRFIERLMLFINAFVIGIFILIVDSRATMFNALVSSGLVWLLIRINGLRFLRWSVVLLPFLPFTLLWLLPLVGQIDGIENVSRSEKDWSTGNGRNYIWEASIETLEDGKPLHLFGYGDFGHYKSGASLRYAYIFGNKRGADAMVVHNAFLQAIFDVGYIGTLIWLIFLYTNLDRGLRLFNKGVALGGVITGFMFYYLLSGITESAFGQYNRAYHLLFLAISTALLILEKVASNPHQEPHKQKADLYYKSVH